MRQSRSPARGTAPNPCGEDVDLDACDGYVVIVTDRQLGEADSYGPYRRAVADAERTRRQRVVDLDALDDVDVQLARFHGAGIEIESRSTGAI